MSLLESIKKKAAKLNRRIVLAEGEEERIIRAAESITRQKIAKVTLIGNPEVMLKKCPDVNLKGVDIFNPRNRRPYLLCRYALRIEKSEGYG